MSRPATDIVLLELAKQLDNLQFLPATTEMEQTLLDLSKQRDTPWKNVTLSPDGKIFRVCVCVRGQRTRIGLTKDFLKALRFADIATLYFWKYRQRKTDCLGDAFFNFRMEDARRDLDSEVDAMMLLLNIEKHLAQEHPDWLEVKPKTRKQTRLDLVQDELKEIQDKLDHIILHLNSLRPTANIKKESVAETGDKFYPEPMIFKYECGDTIRGVKDTPSSPETVQVSRALNDAAMKLFSPSPVTKSENPPSTSK